ncbi:hypothetical protein [Gordonia sp. SID5947]|uniref:hypothetical protein n=1 Tax=Gordonia sp. SID5947 TaxID=2690315 RepID=UPI0031BB15CC
MTVAESLGFLVPVAGMGICASAGWSPLATWLTVAVFGAGEGALLGLGQAGAMHGTEVAVPVLRWVAVTSAAAAFAWLLGSAPSTLHDAGVVDDGSHLASWAAFGVGGLLLLLSIPTAQYLVLRDLVPRAGVWIPVNVLAWSVGLMATFVPGPFVDEDTSAAALVASFAVAGICMALIVSAITGWYLRRRAAALSNRPPGSETCSSLAA